MNDKEEVSSSLVQVESAAKCNKASKINWSDALPQIIASLCSYAIVIQSGVNLAYSAVLLPQLDEIGSEFTITAEQASWIANLVTLSFPFGALSLGLLMDKFGRKKICLLTCFPFIISWALVATAHNITQIYVARILAGVGGGLSAVSLVYVSEICHPVFRPMLLGLNSVFVSLGILITCALGVWFTWRSMAIIFCVMSVLCVGVLIPAPESPHWLVTFSKVGELPVDEISKSLRWIYRNERIYLEQYNELVSNRPKQPIVASYSSINKLNKIMSIFSDYLQPIVYKPTLLLAVLFILQQFSGGYVIIFYAVNVFKSIGGNFGYGLNEFTSLIMIGAIRFIMSIVSSLLSKRFGRKPLLCLSGAGMTICTLGVVVYTTFLTSYDLNFLPLFFVLGYVTFASFGFFVIPWSLVGELFPVKVKATMGGVMITWAYICMFMIVKMFPAMLQLFGITVIFTFYSVVSFVAVCFVWFCLPETFGKSFAEIEKCFQNDS